MATNKVVTKVVADTSGHDSALRKSEAEVLRYSQSVKNANNEMRGLNTNLGKASSSMRTFIGSLGTGKIGSLTSSLQGLSSAFGGLGGNIGNITTSLAGMQGGLTALINPYTAIAAAVVGAGVAFFKYNENLDATTRKVQEVLDVSRDVAMPIRNSIRAIADTYNVEFGDVLKSVNTLMSQFGIDSNRALNIVSKGFQAMGDSGNSLLPLIQQFAPQFRDAGIEASELVAIIANTKGGVFSEEGMSAIAMAGKNIRNMTKSTRESLEAIGIDTNKMITDLTNGSTTVIQEIIKIANKLSKLPQQSQEVGSALQNVFGKQGVRAGQELITALGNVETDLGKMTEKTGEWGESMDRLRAANERLQNQLSSMFGTAEGGFDLIGTKIKTEVLTALSDFIDEVKEVYENSLLLQTAWMTVSTAVQVAWSLIKNVLQMFAGSLVGLEQMIEGLGLAIEAVFEFRDPIKGMQKFEQGWNRLSKAVGDNISDIGRDWEKLYEKYGGERKDIDKQLSHQSQGNTRIGNTWYDANGNKIDDPNKKETPTIIIPTNSKSTGKSKSESKEKKKYTNEEYLRKETIFNDKIRRQLEEQVEKQKRITAEKEKQKKIDAVKNAVQGSPELKSQIEFENALRDANNNRMAEEAAKKQEKLNEALQLTSQAAGAAGSALSTLGQSYKSKDLEAAGIMATAIATVLQGFATATAQAATMGPWVWAAFAVEGLATVATVVSQMRELKKKTYAGGGIVNGTRTIGDMNLARVNDGEMIFNSRQQKNLFNLVNSGVLGGGSDSKNQTVHFRVSGNDLVGVLNNYNNKRSKAR